MDREIRLGLLGFGTVGQGLVEGIQLQEEKIFHRLGTLLRINKALVQDLDKKRGAKLPALTKDANEILDDPEIDIIVEVMGNEHPTYNYVKQALLHHKHVVTANKLLLSLHGPEIQALAHQTGRRLLYEGSVLGGIPILRTIRQGLSGDHVEEVRGILNGTTNFVLTRMVERGEDYEAALRLAQEAGYAESDPTMDVNGLDAACKLVILCRECFEIDLRIEDVAMSGIQQVDPEQIAFEKERGRVPKLVARAMPIDKEKRKSYKRGGVSAKVGIEWLPLTDSLCHVTGVNNGLSLRTRLAGNLFWSGPGAGGLATGGAVLSDVLEAAEDVIFERRLRKANSGK